MSQNDQIDFDENEDNKSEYIIQQEANQIRKNYRNIKEHLTEKRLEFIDPNTMAIEAILEDIEGNFKRVNKPREAVSDMNILREVAILQNERIRNLQCEFRSFNNNEFIDKLKLFMSRSVKNKRTEDVENVSNNQLEEDDNSPTTSRGANTSRLNKKSCYVLTKPIFENFGKDCMNYFNILPKPTSLLGSLNKEILFKQQRVVKQRRANENLEELKTKIKELDVNSKENEENSTVSEIERIFEILKKIHKRALKIGVQIGFYEFVINPFSFSRTIENIFYVSFLIKDGYARISLNSDNLPIIEPTNDEDYNAADASKKKKSVNNIQSMISLTKAQWEEIKEVFNITTALISDPKK